LKDISNFF